MRARCVDAIRDGCRWSRRRRASTARRLVLADYCTRVTVAPISMTRLALSLAYIEHARDGVCR